MISVIRYQKNQHYSGLCRIGEKPMGVGWKYFQKRMIMANNEPGRIRPAQPDDAEVASVLLHSAYIHQQVTYPLSEEHGNRFLKHLQHFFRKAGNRFSYQYIQVAEENEGVVGLVLSFGGR